MDLTDTLITARHPAPGRDDPGAMRDLPKRLLDTWLERTLAERPSRGDLWVFGYGSLIWHPDLEHAERRPATIHGLHRRFCLWQWRHRGTREQPGLMMALVPGGCTRGLAYRVRRAHLERELAKLWRREMRGDGYRPRWVRLGAGGCEVHALVFVANRHGERYAGPLPLDQAARHIAGACGPRGPSAEYLRRTVLALEGLGLRDQNLWRLQRLVAKHMHAELTDGSTGPRAGAATTLPDQS